MLKKYHIQPIILSGGSGTRLWPLSRESFPKQYIKLHSDNYSFLQRTQKRLDGITNLNPPIIISNEQHRFIVAEQMREINIKPKSIILEPFGRNTAAAIATSAFLACEQDNDPILLILSSDHHITDLEEFRNVIKLGLDNAINDKLIIFGVKPEYPSTAYGYIELQSEISNSDCIQVSKFIEKPNKSIAENLYKSNKYLWNSGIFLFKAKTIINELKKFEPNVINYCKKAFINSSKDFDFLRIEAESFKKCPNLSIDVAVLEKTEKSFVLPLNVGWNDIGNWDTLWNLEKRQNEPNVIIGDVETEKVKNCYLNSENKLLVALGIENLIVVQTDDATLVANPKEVQNIKNIVNKLNLSKRSEAKIHRKVFRPWGFFNLIEKEKNWQVKEIHVKPHASLSLQKHKFRSEHWIILEGKGKVEIDGITKILKKNESTYIPIKAKHRLSNPYKKPLVLIEVQSGEYLGEDDIIRYDDQYGRTN